MPGEITVAGLKLARRLLNHKFRSTAGEFLVEGPQAVREAVRYNAARRVLATAEAADRHPDLVDGGYERLTMEQVRRLSETMTSQAIFAICRTPSWSSGDVWSDRSRLVVICAQIRDPGNLGTVIRCADAFGADGVFVSRDSVDVTNPKVVRASVGSLFHLPVVSGVDLEEAVQAAHDAGFRVMAADGGGDDLNALAASGGLQGKTAWIMGNEAWGLPDSQLALADGVVRIPMWGHAESLNLGSAAAVCLYATASAQHARVGV
ncbi:MAG: RNA methyltransferase [Propionibacteriaceae bacterium]|jgi:TrmH family RNA methyltransferase|nr:RNA methyltransferase [Propionibacteriaceae bacterium]